MALIEKALLNSNVISRQDLNAAQADVPMLPEIFHKSSEVRDITNRHTKEYARLVNRGIPTKGSNRNEVLLGKEVSVDVGDPYTDETETLVDTSFSAKKPSQGYEGGESPKDDDCFKRMEWIKKYAEVFKEFEV